MSHLEDLVRRFVSRHSDRPRQRSIKWLQGKRTIIGGSELSAVLGMNPYQSRDDIIKAKAGITSGWGGGNPACWWGTMFESAMERFVGLDCKTNLHGTDISVPAPFEGHANSPDGYCVLRFTREADGVFRVVTTSEEALEDSKEAPQNSGTSVAVGVLLEIKCPYRRKPKGEVPGHYYPQIWSGLALSPVAQFGLFVDAVFRKCSLFDLGPSRLYDYGYHRERNHWNPPVAWGVTGVYAPRLDVAPDGTAPRHGTAQAGTAQPDECENPAYDAWLEYYTHMAGPPDFGGDGTRNPDPIDLGDSESAPFDRALRMINTGQLLARHLDPCFSDGRPLGEPLHTAREIGQAIDKLQAEAPGGRYLWGFIPWKLFEVHYVPVERRPGFLDEIRPEIQGVLELARQFRASPNPALAFYNYKTQEQQQQRQRQRQRQQEVEEAKTGRTTVTDEDALAFFNSL